MNKQYSNKALRFLPLFLLFCVSATSAFAQDNSKPIRGECEYYQYEDSIRQCGKRGYLIRYGYKYCNFFMGTHYDRWSEEGQKWATEMGYCLQMSIYELPDSLSCKELKKLASKSHLPCLLESGYLDLSKKDKRVYKRLGARNPLNWPTGLYYLMKLRKAGKAKRKAERKS